MVSGIKVKLKANATKAEAAIGGQINTLIKDIEKTLKTTYIAELKKQLLTSSVQNYFISKTLQVFAEIQAEYFSSSVVASQDPTSFLQGGYISSIETEIRNNFALAATSVSPDSELELVLLSDGFCGFGKEGDVTGTAPIQWLVYFLVGSFGNDLYWISLDAYEAIKGRSPGQLGRFGDGHLWTITSGEEKLSINSRLKSAGYSYSLEQLKHPQSGKAGKNWFAGVLSEEEIQSMVIQPAVENAVKYVQARYANSK